MEHIPKKLYYKIGEVCDLCDIEPHVLRYWETEFSQLSPSKNNSGQRVYRYRDLQVVQRIKQLLYQEGYTIAGANKKLAAEKFDFDEERAPATTVEANNSLPAREVQETSEARPSFAEGAQFASERVGADKDSKKLLEEIRSQLKSVLEILR